MAFEFLACDILGKKVFYTMPSDLRVPYAQVWLWVTAILSIYLVLFSAIHAAYFLFLVFLFLQIPARIAMGKAIARRHILFSYASFAAMIFMLVLSAYLAVKKTLNISINLPFPIYFSFICVLFAAYLPGFARQINSANPIVLYARLTKILVISGLSLAALSVPICIANAACGMEHLWGSISFLTGLIIFSLALAPAMFFHLYQWWQTQMFVNQLEAREVSMAKARPIPQQLRPALPQYPRYSSRRLKVCNTPL